MTFNSVTKTFKMIKINLLILFYYIFYFLDGGRKFGPPREDNYGPNLVAQNSNNLIPLRDDHNHQSSCAAQTEKRP